MISSSSIFFDRPIRRSNVDATAGKFTPPKGIAEARVWYDEMMFD
jgi:hypothetical protein